MVHKSLLQIAEDLKIVNHIRGVFSELQDSLAISMESSCLVNNLSRTWIFTDGIANGTYSYLIFGCFLDQSDVTTRTSGSGVHNDCLQNVDGRIDRIGVDFLSPMHFSVEKPDHYYSYNFSIPGSYQNQMVQMINKHVGDKNSVQGCAKSGNLQPPPTSKRASAEQQKHEPSRGVGDTYDASVAAVNSAMQMSCLPPQVHASTPSNVRTELSSVPEPELPDVLLCQDPANVLHRFCAGYELFEALGPAFQKQNTNYEWGSETDMAVEMSEEMPSSSLITANSGTENLLEAVVANINNEVDKIDNSLHKSEFLLNSEKMSEPCTSDVGSISSAGYSFDRETLNSLNSSGAYGVRYSKGFSSTSCSRGSETLEKPQESNKVHKKRARPGESCRPRPRDRQLIQDRIKELRELVPNGSKVTSTHSSYALCLRSMLNEISINDNAV